VPPRRRLPRSCGRQRHVLALEFAMDFRPVRLDLATMPLLVAGGSKPRGLKCRLAISSGRGQVRPGSLEAIVCQTLDEFIAQSTVKSTGSAVLAVTSAPTRSS
jgi:hypothetical protein